MSPANRRVIHIEKDDSYITLGEGSGGVTGPKPPTGGGTGTTGVHLVTRLPPGVTQIGPYQYSGGGGTVTPPTGIQMPTVFEPKTPKGEGFQALWPTTVKFDFNQSVSIAAQNAPDPYETAILPKSVALLMPFQVGSSSRWRYKVLRKLHPDWTTKEILAVIFK